MLVCWIMFKLSIVSQLLEQWVQHSWKRLGRLAMIIVLVSRERWMTRAFDRKLIWGPGAAKSYPGNLVVRVILCCVDSNTNMTDIFQHVTNMLVTCLKHAKLHRKNMLTSQRPKKIFVQCTCLSKTCLISFRSSSGTSHIGSFSNDVCLTPTHFLKNVPTQQKFCET